MHLYEMIKVLLLVSTIPHVVHAFSSPSSKSRYTTKLHEQPVNIRNLLGPISPSTLEKYNLPPDVLQNEWSAEVVTRTASKLASKDSNIGGNEILGKQTTDIQLIPKNMNDHYVDTFTVKIPIPLDSPGLGLLEVEGGREDGLGITIVNGLVAGGNAERAMLRITEQGEDENNIMYGDSIVNAELILTRRGSLQTDINSIRTECLGYDATVDALVGMLSTLNNNQDNSIQEALVLLTLKRIRRRPRIQVKVNYPPSDNLPPETLQLQPGENLRLAMLQRGIKLNDPLAQRYDGKATGSGNCGGAASELTFFYLVDNFFVLLFPHVYILHHCTTSVSNVCSFSTTRWRIVKQTKGKREEDYRRDSNQQNEIEL